MGHYVGHTDAEISAMLEFLGMETLDDLYGHIPDAIRLALPLQVAPGRAESDVLDEINQLAQRNQSPSGSLINFAGFGSYEHELPSAVRALTFQSEFVTSYTPYQPEISQGVLQALFEYQTMVCSLFGLDVANASLYDGASAAAEGLNLAAAATGRRMVWVSRGVHPNTRAVIATLCGPRLEIREAPLVDGRTCWPIDLGEPAALLVGYPNALGVIEEVNECAALAHGAGAQLVVVADPVAAGVLPSAGSLGADIAVGEGQPFGTPMGFGGPYVGLFATRNAPWVRRWFPGRIVGETLDTNSKTSYVLTLSTREQHIRRADASSNICTNQTLIAIAAAIHLAWLGPGGLRELALRCLRGARYAREQIANIPGVELAFDSPSGYEMALKVPLKAAKVLERLRAEGFIGGVDLATDYPELGEAILVTVTETRTASEIDQFAVAMAKVLK